MGSALDDILNGTVATMTALGLTVPNSGAPIPVVKRKLPQKAEVLDPPIQITVCRSDSPEGFRYFAFGGKKSKAYLVLIVIISPNDQDMISNLPIYSQWRQQIMDKYDPDGGFGTKAAMQSLAGSASVWDIRVKPGVFLDRRMISDNYDYQAVNIEFSATE